MWYDGPFLFISEDPNRNNIGHHEKYICIKCRLKSENNLIIIAVPITQHDINNIKSNKISYDKIFLQSNVYYKGWFDDYDSLEVEVFDLNEDIKEQLFGGEQFCEGGTLVITAAGGNSYSWASGDTSSQITVSSPGIYSVTVSLNGCSASTYTYISTLSNPCANAQ